MLSAVRMKASRSTEVDNIDLKRMKMQTLSVGRIDLMDVMKFPNGGEDARYKMKSLSVVSPVLGIKTGLFSSLIHCGVLRRELVVSPLGCMNDCTSVEVVLTVQVKIVNNFKAAGFNLHA